MKIQENVSLAGQTSFRVGGAARYFFDARDKDDLVRAVFFAKEKGLPFFILGGGSNLLVSDEGFDGTVILANNEQRRVSKNIIKSEAGVKLSDLVRLSVENGLTGLEWAVGIPGTIGGAVKVNAHAFGSDISQLVKNIEKEDNIIFSVELELKKGDKEKSEKLIREYFIKRKETQPLNYPSAGCIFKNPPGRFAGKLIDDCGLKGERMGEAEISKKHANFIINLGGARAKDIAALIALAKTEVKKKFGLDLKEEIERVGF
ncbi:FAD-binding protein [Patescibacteria group bacterium]|nr:FAD-binding protein [Patescibacteria group bacterium]MBU2579444.1 FAD-binding protein [Patescibacteria group bacterium]